jgi:hypothetical protein
MMRASVALQPFRATTQLRELSHPFAANNIEGGIGFLAGLHTHVFPFAGCIPLCGRAAAVHPSRDRSIPPTRR